MSHVFIDEDTVKKIIKEMYQRNHIAGLICELAWLRNFRVGDVRKAKVSHFRKDNGYPEIYLGYDKMQSKTWYPIPQAIYCKILEYIENQNLKPNDHVFEIWVKHPGAYYNHKGIITHNYILHLWYSICKHINIYTEVLVHTRQCKKCDYSVGQHKCNIYGKDHIKRRVSVRLNRCIDNGTTIIRKRKHPALHESLRGSSAQHKIRCYMKNGLDYETALLKVFHASNWKSYKVFKTYLDSAFEKEMGDRIFVDDWINKELI